MLLPIAILLVSSVEAKLDAELLSVLAPSVCVATWTVPASFLAMPSGAPVSIEWKSAPRVGRNRILLRAGDASAWALLSLKHNKRGQPSSVRCAQDDEVALKKRRAEPPVARGSEVLVVSRVRDVAVSARGRLEAQARVGDRAKVRLFATQRLVHGTLVDANTLVVRTEAP